MGLVILSVPFSVFSDSYILIRIIRDEVSYNTFFMRVICGEFFVQVM